MATVAHKGPVERLIAEIVAEVRSGCRSDLSTRREAQTIVARLSEENPEALLEWFRGHMEDLIAQRIRVELAQARQAMRRHAFHPDDIPISPFLKPYAGKGNEWKPLGEMLRPDWTYVLERNRNQARASLFEIELARQIISKMPDDVTPTREVVSEWELERLEIVAHGRAEEIVGSP